MRERTGWRDEALCATYPMEWWFAPDAESRRSARAVCKMCTAREDCLADALEAPAGKGIRAGLVPSQITKLKKQRRAA